MFYLFIKTTVLQVASAHAYSGMYVLAVAARPLEPQEAPAERAEAERHLTLLGAAATAGEDWRNRRWVYDT